MMDWGEKGNKVFWFVERKDGNQCLVRPDGTSVAWTETDRYFYEKSPQAHAGWQRARLFMQEYGIWDGTSFACSMDTVLAYPVERDRNGKRAFLFFATCQLAEKYIYPLLDRDQINQCRANVDRFYQDANLQAAWNGLILYPVCLKAVEGANRYIPISIADLGDGEQVLGNTGLVVNLDIVDQNHISDLFTDDPLFVYH